MTSLFKKIKPFELIIAVYESAVNSNFWFAGAIISCSVFSAKFVNIAWNYHTGLIILFSILFGYNYDRLIDMKIQKSERSNSQVFYKKAWIVYSIVSILISIGFIIYSLIISPNTTKIIVIYCITMGLLYGLPFIPIFEDKHFRLIRFKDIPGLKSLLVSSTFSIGIVGLPLSFNIHQEYSVILVYYASIFIFVMMFTGTVSFDIRDFYSDKAHKVPTIPVLLGIRNTKILLLSLNGMSTALIFCAYLLGSINLFFLIAVFISNLYISLYVVYTGEEMTRKNDSYYEHAIVAFYLPLIAYSIFNKIMMVAQNMIL